MRSPIWIDIQKIKNPYSGLGQFCHYLKDSLSGISAGEDALFFFTGKEKWLLFINRLLFNQVLKIQVWHAIHQEASLFFVPYNCKLILTVHDLNFLYKYTGIKRWWKKQRLLHKLKKADAITAISHFTKNELIENLAIDAAKITVIYNGANQLATPAAIAGFPFLSGDYFLAIGIVQPKKNFEVLLNLLKGNKENLVIAGDDSFPYANHIRQQAAASGLLGRIYCTGKITEGEKSWLLHHCKAFMFPSLHEGFGMPVVEALAVGKLCFVAKSSSLPEVGGEAVFYFDSFDEKKMRQTVATGLELYDKDVQGYAIQAQRQAAKFDWHDTAKKYLALYQHENSI